MDLQQVEVLRGPQGPIIGKNTSLGAINITPNKPTDEARQRDTTHVLGVDRESNSERAGHDCERPEDERRGDRVLDDQYAKCSANAQ